MNLGFFTITTSNPDFIVSMVHYLPGDDNQFYMYSDHQSRTPTGVITITTNDPNQEEITFNVKVYGIEPPVDISTEDFDLIVGTSVTKR